MRTKPRVKRDPTFTVIGSDGAAQFYADEFRDVTPEIVQTAIMVEDSIRSTKRKIEESFLEMAYKLDIFDEERLYLARSFSSIEEWAKSPEIELSPRVVVELLRIKREVMPLVEKMYGDRAKQVVLSAGVSKVRAALPLLNIGRTSELLELLKDAPQMPLRDVQFTVKEIRGGIVTLTDERPVVFIAKVREGETFSRIEITSTTGSRTERCGTLTMRNEYVDRWAERFGKLYTIVGKD